MLIGPSHSVLQALGSAPAAVQPMRTHMPVAASEAAVDVKERAPATEVPARGRTAPARVPTAEVPTRNDATAASRNAAGPARRIDILV